jgi:hypothetical protein
VYLRRYRQNLGRARNLAAFHGCALLLGTSCEEFNRFLDRGLVIGTFSDPDLGFFSDFGLGPSSTGHGYGLSQWHDDRDRLILGYT